MNTRTFAQYVRRGWKSIVVFAIVITALASFGSVQGHAKYTASAQGFISIADAAQRPPSVLTSGSLYILARMTSYAQLAQTTAVLGPVASDLSYPGGEAALQSAVSAASEVNTTFIDISVGSADPALAARAANAIVTQLSSTVHSYENGMLQLKLSSAAQTPVSPSNRDLKLNLALAATAALLLGCASCAGLGWLRDERTTYGKQPPGASV